jgi:hypothetical protein
MLFLFFYLIFSLVSYKFDINLIPKWAKKLYCGDFELRKE